MLVREARVNGKRVAARTRAPASRSSNASATVSGSSSTPVSPTKRRLISSKHARTKHFVAPGIAWLINTSYNASEWGITPEIAKSMGYHRELEVAVETLRKMHKRGIRVLPGGDYGFAWIPHGTNAKDLEYFVKYLGFTPMEALMAATKYGGQVMLKPNELGQIKEGYLADLLLVDGDPVSNISILQDKNRLLAIMKDGEFHKAPEIAAQRTRLAV
jgi:imidazolonepropionase-like amidohydrolase